MYFSIIFYCEKTEKKLKKNSHMQNDTSFSLNDASFDAVNRAGTWRPSRIRHGAFCPCATF